MLLKTIYIQGFKSFLNKTKIDFNESITGIVGPNGSGKSNISDAITWVLGETSIKNLRGSKMEDVIFSGTDKRHGTGFAEVSIVFDNKDKSIPIDFQEVQITRRMYRSLESEFLINGTKCRLKDIRELFLDTGIGKDGYSLIGQGQIDRILSNKPDERRQVFEETAGVSKFKLRKHESELKLKRTEDNITRLKDIVSELELREGELEISSKNALIYKEKSAELEKLEIQSAAFEFHSLNEKISKEEQTLQNLRNNRETLATQLEEEKQNVFSYEEKIEQSDANIETLRLELKNIEFNIQKEESELEINRVRLENYKANLVADNDKIVEIDESTKTYNDKINTLLAEKNEIENKNLELKTKITEKDFEINSLLSEIEKKQLNIDSLNSEKKNIENEITSIESKLSLLDVMKKEKTNRLNNIKENLRTLSLNNSEIDTRKIESEKSYSITIEKVKEIRLNISKYLEEKKAVASNLSIITNELNEKSRKISQKEAHLNALINLNNSYEGYNKSVKSLMNVRKSGGFSSEIIGPVAENFSVKKEFEVAISVALGTAIQNIIVDRLDSAKKIIKYLNDKKMGRVTFLPIDSMSYKKPSINLSSNSGFLGFADELVEYDNKYENIFKNLLGRIIVTKDFDSANKISKQLENRYRIVTLSGDSFNIGGSVTGGSINKFSSEIVSRKNEINKLSIEIENDKVEFSAIQNNMANANKKHEKIEKYISELNDELTLNNSEIIKIENNLANLKNSLNSNQQYINKYTIEEDELSKQIEEDTKNLFDLNERKSVLEKELENKIDVIVEDDTVSMKKSLDENRELKLELTLKYNENESLVNSILRECKLIDSSEKQAQETKVLLQKNIKELSTQIENLQIQTTKSTEQFSKLNSEKEKCLFVLTEAENERKAISISLKNNRHKIDELQESRVEVDNEVAKSESKIDRFNDRLEMIKGHIFETYGYVDLPTVKDESIVKNSKAIISNLKTEIANLGTINLGAIEEYQALMQRLEFTRSQINDLVESKKEIEEIILKLDNEIKTLFSTTFNKVSKYFEEIFKILFNGGRAKIELEDNSLESGIEIMAEPPGKKLKSLSLLSGGERAVTAVALLFALLKVRPAPFCILDEIDAALDDANIKRYTDYLLTLEGTQFILITHRKISMEIANVLYGVTMEEKGISKLISVKLD